MAAAHGACLPLQEADNKVYDESRGKELIDSAKNITDVVAKVPYSTIQYAITEINNK